MSLPEEVGKAAADAIGKVAGDVYADVLHPAAQEVGTALGTIFKVGLSPFAMLNWGFDKSKAWLTAKVAERLETIPEEDRRTPPSHIAVPLLLAIATAPDAEELRGLYAELLMKSMDGRTQSDVHPSYVALLQQMTPQEALVFVSFRKFKYHELFRDEPSNAYRTRMHIAPSIEDQFHSHCEEIGIVEPDSSIWLDNFLRLRLLELTTSSEAQLVQQEEWDGPPTHVKTKERRVLSKTEYGASFLDACTPPATLAPDD
jgi:Abortive infection alpha